LCKQRPVFGAYLSLGVNFPWAVVTGLSKGAHTIDWPDSYYYVVIALSLILAALSVLATSRSTAKNTGITTTRYE
jgi:hypothetical protein